jgi:hypothetical protein
MAPLHRQVLDVDVERLRHPQPEQAEEAGQRVSTGPAAAPWAMKAPSSMRSRPSVADSVSILGRRTYSAGEWSMTPSMTAKR